MPRHSRIALASLLLLLAPVAITNGANNYNVLLIAVDDLRPELGSYGRTPSVSPHLDDLAKTSSRFTNHFVQVPTCGASRYALLTGRSPHHSGALRNNAFYGGSTSLSAKQLPGAQTLPELFRRSGYHTTLIGKISHTPDGKVYEYNGAGDGRPELPHAWDELATPYGVWKRGWGVFFAYADGKHREDGQGHNDLMQFTAASDTDLPDGMLADAAIEKLRDYQKMEKPFFLGLGFIKPHLPFVAPKQDWEAVAEFDIGPAPNGTKPNSAYWHRSSEFHRYKMPFAVTQPLAPEDQVMVRKAYLACVRYTDRQIGKVLATLRETGLDESTIVVLWGDHGWQLGESALWGKHVLYDRALRSPLLIQVPGMTRGQASEAMVETLDIYPTLVDLCEPQFQQTAYPLDGQSLAPLLREEATSVRKAAISYYGNAVSVRTANYRLIARRKDDRPHDVELYDMRESPDPQENLAPSLPQRTEELLRLLPSS